jgi:hypothetical protein
MTSIVGLCDVDGELLDVGEDVGVSVESAPHPANAIVEIRVATKRPRLVLRDF